MKAKNTIGKIYVSQCLFRAFCKHFVKDFKLQLVEQIGTKLSNLYLSYSSFHRLNTLILKDLTSFITPDKIKYLFITIFAFINALVINT